MIVIRFDHFVFVREINTRPIFSHAIHSLPPSAISNIIASTLWRPQRIHRMAVCAFLQEASCCFPFLRHSVKDDDHACLYIGLIWTNAHTVLLTTDFVDASTSSKPDAFQRRVERNHFFHRSFAFRLHSHRSHSGNNF